MPSNFPTPQELEQQTALLQRMSNAGYAGIPTGGNPNYGMIQSGQAALPQLSPLQAMGGGQPPLNPVDQQAQLLKQLGQGANATGYRSMKSPSVIPLNAVFQNADNEFNIHAEPMASGNKYRAINAEIAGPLGGGELAIQGGAGRMFGQFKSPADVEIGAKYTHGFAAGGFVDGESLVEPIDINTQQQINTMMSNGGLASTSRQDLSSFAKGGSVKDKLRSEFEKRGLDFDKFINTRAGAHQAAQALQEKGQNGDTILAHINPREAAMLKQMGGSGRINPETGLMSFDEFGDFGGGWYGSSDPIGGTIGGGTWGVSTPDYSSSYTPYIPVIDTSYTPLPTVDTTVYTPDYGGTTIGYTDPGIYDPGTPYTPDVPTPAPDVQPTPAPDVQPTPAPAPAPDTQTSPDVQTTTTYTPTPTYTPDVQAPTGTVVANTTLPDTTAAAQAAAQQAAAQQAAELAAQKAAELAAQQEAARIAAETATNQQNANIDTLTSGLGLSTPAAYANLVNQDYSQTAAASGQPQAQAAQDQTTANQPQTPASTASSLADLASSLLGITPAAAATLPSQSANDVNQQGGNQAQPVSNVQFENPNGGGSDSDQLANLYNFYQAGANSQGTTGFGPNPQVGPANQYTIPYYPTASEAQQVTPMGSQGNAAQGFYSGLDAMNNPVALPAGQNSLYVSGQGPGGQVLGQTYMTGQPSVAPQNQAPLNVELVNAADVPGLLQGQQTVAQNPLLGPAGQTSTFTGLPNEPQGFLTPQQRTNAIANAMPVERGPLAMTPEAQAAADKMQAANAAQYDQQQLANAKAIGRTVDSVLGEGTTQSVLNKIAEAMQNNQNEAAQTTAQLAANPQTTANNIAMLQENAAKNQAAIDALTGKTPAAPATNVATAPAPVAQPTTITTIPQPNVTPPQQVAQIPTPPVAPEGTRTNSIVDKITTDLTNKVNDIMQNPLKYGVNAASTLNPVTSLYNLSTLATGLPTTGQIAQNVLGVGTQTGSSGSGGAGGSGSGAGTASGDAKAANEAAAKAAAEGDSGKGGGSGTVLPSAYTPATPKVTAPILSGGGGGGQGTVPTGGTVAYQYPVGPLSNRQFAGYANNLNRYGYGKEHKYYTYAATGGKVSPLNAMRKA